MAANRPHRHERSSLHDSLARTSPRFDSTPRKPAHCEEKVPRSLFRWLIGTLDERSRHALTASALLPAITADALTRLTGDIQTPSILEHLSRTFPFVFREATEPASYQIHPMLRRYLRSLEQGSLPATIASDTRDRYDGGDDAIDARTKAHLASHDCTVPDSTPRVRIDLLGGLAIRQDGVVIPCTRRPMTMPITLLLALVAMGAADVPVPRVADLLWSDVADDRARARARVVATVHRANRLLGRPHALCVDRASVSLDRQHVAVDTLELPQRLHAAQRPDLDATEASKEILAAYPGTLLPEEKASSWVLAYREQLAGEFANAVLHAGGRLESVHGPETARGLYVEALRREPLAISVRVRLWEINAAQTSPESR